MTYRGRQLRQRDPKTGRLFRVIGSATKLASPPPALRKARLDNLTLVPGNLLPFKAQYQRIANALPAGAILLVLPPNDTTVGKAARAVGDVFRAQGHRVTTIAAESLDLARSLGERNSTGFALEVIGEVASTDSLHQTVPDQPSPR